MLVADGLQTLARRRLHGQQADDLEQVVLDDVPDRPDLVVERPAIRDIERFGQRDLDTGDPVAVPDRLEERVGEPEIEQVLDALLAEEVVDPEDRLVSERPRRTAALRVRALARSRPKGFSRMTRAPSAEPDCSSPSITGPKRAGGIAR